jgi:hypothetical protein
MPQDNASASCGKSKATPATSNSSAAMETTNVLSFVIVPTSFLSPAIFNFEAPALKVSVRKADWLHARR